ncbi:MAG: hypothetical protein AMXMBFR64_52640 [Myxococcales bacterium]
MARSARRKATYDDVIRVPDHQIAEILDGELVVSPRPAPKHAAVGTLIGADLCGPFHRRQGGAGGPGGWRILDEPELHLGGHVIVPDLAGWRRERLPRLPDAAAIEVVPDWVCEIYSPTSKRTDRLRKTRIYASLGVSHLWRVDPLELEVEILRLSGEHYLVVDVHSGAGTVRAEPFDAVPLDLGRWWDYDDDVEPPTESP